MKQSKKRLTGQTGHGDTVGAIHGHNKAVGRDGGGQSGDDKRLGAHFDSESGELGKLGKLEEFRLENA